MLQKPWEGIYTSKRTRNDDPLALVKTLTTTNNSVITAILFHIWENRKSHGYKGQHTLPLADKLGKVNRNKFLYCIKKESTVYALREKLLQFLTDMNTLKLPMPWSVMTLTTYEYRSNCKNSSHEQPGRQGVSSLKIQNPIAEQWAGNFLYGLRARKDCKRMKTRYLVCSICLHPETFGGHIQLCYFIRSILSRQIDCKPNFHWGRTYLSSSQLCKIACKPQIWIWKLCSTKVLPATICGCWPSLALALLLLLLSPYPLTKSECKYQSLPSQVLMHLYFLEHVEQGGAW